MNNATVSCPLEAGEGMDIGASPHRIEHWFFMGHGKEFDSDIKEPMVRGDFYWPAMAEPNHHDLFSTPKPSQEYIVPIKIVNK